MQEFTRTLAMESQRGYIQVYPGGTLTVYTAGSTTLATLYEADEVTTKANPVVADANGLVQFKVANGTYDFVSSNSVSQVTESGVLAFDPAEAGLNGDNEASVAVVTVVTCSTPLPIDDTIPQNTEGDQVATLSFTPNSGSNNVEITVHVSGSTTSGMFIGGAVFQDTTANALTGSACMGQTTGANQKFEMSWSFRVSAGSTAARTYKLRLGPASTGTVYVNGDSSGNRLLGGAMEARITAREVP